MSTCTCELIFGKACQNNSGILFNDRLTLYEGSRAMLAFERKPTPTTGGALVDRWIPHAEKILEDSMIMLAGYGAGDETVLQLIAEAKQVSSDQHILDLSSVDDALMEKLYAAAKQAFKLEIVQGKHSRSSERWKVVACIFQHSSMLQTVQRFHDYDIDLEVCQSVYKSEYSPWNEKINTWGEFR